MASNVFGTPITDETLKAMPEYHGKQISQKDRACVAMDMKNAEGKDVNALKFVEALRKQFPEEQATLCLIYNATGGPVTCVRDYQWEGHLCGSPYPVVISNGQWGAFLHGQWHYKADTQASVVYSGKNNGGDYMHWLITWRHNTNGINRVNYRTNYIYNNLPIFTTFSFSRSSISI
jgi:hypothetical protein